MPSGAGADVNTDSLDGPSAQSLTYLAKLSTIAFALWGRLVIAVSFPQIIQSHFKSLCFEITLAVRHTVCCIRRILSCHVCDSPSTDYGGIVPRQAKPNLATPEYRSSTNKVLLQD